MLNYIIFVVLVSIAFGLWFHISVSNTKKSERYTQDEDKKNLWEPEKMMEHLKDKPLPPETPKPQKTEDKKTKAPSHKTKEKPKVKTKDQDYMKSFDLEQAILSTEILKRKDEV